ncbi:hypothetical protein F5X98DRAFT_390911 [Xylaria grammica]|nr:hypothetical protein F5X98DRAFT_390911 [Xylaria grammica]
MAEAEFYVEKEAVINYQGYDLAAMKRQRKDDRVYLSELDVHFPELTLGQTLTFTASMRNKYLVKNAGNAIASFFGLDAAFDTRARNRGIRGISGGEKGALASWRDSFMALKSNAGIITLEALTAGQLKASSTNYVPQQHH